MTKERQYGTTVQRNVHQQTTYMNTVIMTRRIAISLQKIFPAPGRSILQVIFTFFTQILKY